LPFGKANEVVRNDVDGKLKDGSLGGWWVEGS
jgi:hypothetical protein